MTAVLHINCRLVSNLFEIKTCTEVSNKTLFEPFMQKRRKRLDHCNPPFKHLRRHGDEPSLKKIPPATQIPKEVQRTCRSKKTCLVVSCMQTCSMLRDPCVRLSQPPKWLWQVLYCKRPFGSSSLHSSQHASHIRTNQTSL